MGIGINEELPIAKEWIWELLLCKSE